MPEQERITTVDELAKHVGQYPEHAFLFVREGLSATAERVHGPETDAHRRLQQFILEQDIDWPELVARYHAGSLPGTIKEGVDSAGGCEKLDRHITGTQLCWGLREFAAQRWGLMARTVLESWNIRTTDDFGRIVFGFIDMDLMRKKPDDCLEDFHDVYKFDEAFNIPLRPDAPPASDGENSLDADTDDSDVDTSDE